MSTTRRPWVVIAGGGTAGHVSPGLAVAEELVGRGVARREVAWIGSARGLETRLVPEAGFPLTALPGRGIQRRLTPANVGAAAGLVVGVVRAVASFARRRPAVVLVLGGYASVPALVAAAVWRVPVVLTEQNAVPSVANRLASRVARACATPFPDVGLRRATWTGNPVRSEILAVDRAAQRIDARRRLGVGPDRVLLVVMGGSLGARRINEAMVDAIPVLRDRGDLAIRHISGVRDHADVAARVRIDPTDELQYELVPYEDDMATLYAAADLVVSRAGGNTVAELAVVGLPAVLVPLPGAPGDHQTANAAALARVDAAVVIPDEELDAPRLLAELEELIADGARRDEMARAAAAVGRPDAAAAIAGLVIHHARRPLPERSAA